MPAPTWHFLNMNDVAIQIGDKLESGLDAHWSVKSSGACTIRKADGEFEGAMARAQEAWEKTHPMPSPEELAKREEYRTAEADATYGGTARSAYQANADALEESRSLMAAFEQGTGADVAGFLRETAGDCMAVQVGPGKTARVQMALHAAPENIGALAVDVLAERGSAVELFIVVDSPSGDDSSCGVAGTTLRVFAEADSRVSIVRTQALGDSFTDIDDMGLFADARASIEVRQTVLGGGTTFTGLAGDLRGDSAEANVDTRYLGHGTQRRDFNYALRLHGTRTRCNLNANGVLAGESSKTLRGTIDLVRGCKGAEGSENETVLLVDEGVRNKTVPVILCNEDDVAGNHGATIGHIRDEQLFYLASRGLSQEAAETMFVGAVLEQAAIDAPDEAARDAVIRLGERRSPGFADLVDEGGWDA